MPRITSRNLLRIGLTWIAGLLSFAVLGRGLYWAQSIDVRMDPVLSILFCVLPILSFPVFLVSIAFRKMAVLQPILAVAFVAVYAVLNWRTCSALSYCSSVSSVVLVTLATPVSMAFFAVAVTSVGTLALNGCRQSYSDTRTAAPTTPTAAR